MLKIAAIRSVFASKNSSKCFAADALQQKLEFVRAPMTVLRGKPMQVIVTVSVR